MGLAHSQTPEHGGIGEAWTSVPGGEGIRAGWRMFTAPQLADICPSMGVPAKLRVPDTPLRLVVGEWFSLNRLTIHALDSEGRGISPVPIALLAESSAAKILDLHTGTLSGGRVLPIGTGDFHIRVQTICGDMPGDPPVEAFIQVTAVEQ